MDWNLFLIIAFAVASGLCLYDLYDFIAFKILEFFDINPYDDSEDKEE